MVFRRKMVRRTLFRKLPFGALYWPSTSMGATAPYVKLGRRASVSTRTGNHVGQTPVANTAIETVTVDRAFLPYAGAAAD